MDPINITCNQAVNYQFAGDVPTGWTGRLPAGLTITGNHLSGTPIDVAGTYNIELLYGSTTSDPITLILVDLTARGVPVVSCPTATPTDGGGTITASAGNFSFLIQTTNISASTSAGWSFSPVAGINNVGSTYGTVASVPFSATLTAGSYVFPIAFTNFAHDGGLSQTTNYILTINVTPALPVISLADATSLSSFTGKAVAAQFAVQAYAAPVAWSATSLPPGCVINTSTGLISGIPTTAGSFDTVVTATNSTGSATFAATFAIAAATPAPVISCSGATPTDGGGTLNKTAGDVNCQFIATNGGSNWSAALPSGLNLNAAYGSVTGTLEAGTYDIVVSCSNTPYPNGPAQTMQYVLALTVAAALPVISLGDASGLNVTAGTAVAAQFSVQSYAGAVVWSATGLPTGCSINASTGQVSGLPNFSGTFSATITATNSAGAGTYAASFVIAASANSTAPTYQFLIDDPTLTDLQIDVRTCAVTSSRAVALKQFTQARFALIFEDGGAPVAPPDVDTVKQGIRPKDQFEADYLFPESPATLVAATDTQPAYLLVALDISGDALATELKTMLDAATPSTFSAMTDVTWKVNGVPRASQTFNFTILPAVTY